MPATSAAALPAPTDAATAARRWAAPLWVGALLIILAFLVIYPLPMLFFGAVSDSSPVMTGMTGLYVTHDQSEAVVLGDRIGVMKDGKLLQMAPPGEIYNRPADSFVANFTGASNVLKGKVLERNGDQAIIDLGAAGRISDWTPQPLSPGDNARVALRAENIRLGERGPTNSFTGRVTERRYQGMQTIYDVEFGDQKVEVLELGTAARHNDG